MTQPSDKFMAACRCETVRHGQPAHPNRIAGFPWTVADRRVGGRADRRGGGGGDVTGVARMTLKGRRHPLRPRRRSDAVRSTVAVVSEVRV